jgi:hypothetical protein
MEFGSGNAGCGTKDSEGVMIEVEKVKRAERQTKDEGRWMKNGKG